MAVGKDGVDGGAVDDGSEAVEGEAGDSDEAGFAGGDDFAECGEGFGDDLVEVAEFDVVALDDVDVGDAEACEAFVDAGGDAGGGEVEVFGFGAVAADFGGEDVAVAFNALEGFAEEGFGFGESVVGGAVDEVDSEVEGSVDGADAFGLSDAAEDGAEWGGTVGECGDGESGVAEGIVFHVCSGGWDVGNLRERRVGGNVE